MKKGTNRRTFIKKTGIISAGSLFISKIPIAKKISNMFSNSPVLNIESLHLPWKTQDPFIFCSYHFDLYPGGNDMLGPNASLEGRNLGQDFEGKDGWNMYHGTKVPGFPAHPHSGFETVTIVTKGMVDHSDSLGAKGRFGNGDVQWLTAGRGVQHAEMFPLLNKNSNPFEIFQIWMNLPKKDKKVDPHYKMLWREDIPNIIHKDKAGKESKIKLVAGNYKDQHALSPTPNSWAADKNNHVQIWIFEMEANAAFTIPADLPGLSRSLFFYEGQEIKIDDLKIDPKKLIELDSSKQVNIQNSSEKAYFLFLQGRPINERMEQYGPFVANSREEINEIMKEFQRTEFGGWPWDRPGPVHDKSLGRFSKVGDGNEIIK